MADVPAAAADAAERFQKLSRLLHELKVTEEYLRQYPGLAEKLAALAEAARSSQDQG